MKSIDKRIDKNFEIYNRQTNNFNHFYYLNYF